MIRRTTPAQAWHRVRPSSARSPGACSGHHVRDQARSAGRGGGPGRSAPLPVSTSTSRGPSGVSSATSSGMLSSHSLAITSPVIASGGDACQRMRGSSPSGRGVISTARAAIRAASPRSRPDRLASSISPSSWPSSSPRPRSDIDQVEPGRVAECGVDLAQQAQHRPGVGG